MWVSAGYEFSTHASRWIRQAITRTIADHVWPRVGAVKAWGLGESGPFGSAQDMLWMGGEKKEDRIQETECGIQTREDGRERMSNIEF